MWFQTIQKIVLENNFGNISKRLSDYALALIRNPEHIPGYFFWWF
jgi:hypothetical protein